MSNFNAGAIEANLTLDRSSWQRAYRQTLAEVQRLEDITINIPIDADTAAFAGSMANIQRQLRDLENDSVNIPVDADTLQAATSLQLLQRRIRDMDGETINVNVDVDRSGLDRLDQRLTSLVGGGEGGGGGHMGLFRLLLLGLLALAPVVSSAILGIVGAVIALSAALVSGGGALGIFGLGVFGVIQKYKTLSKENDNLTGKYGELQDALGSLTDTWHDWITAIENPAIDVMVQAIELLNSVIPDMTPIFEGAATAVSGLLDELSGWVGGSDYKEMLDFFGRIGPDMITSFGHIFGNLAVFFGQLLDAFEPVTRSLMGGLERITAGWADWARNLEDNPAFQDFLDDIQTYGPQALQVLVSFYNALRNIGEALEPFAEPMAEGLIAFFDAIANASPDNLTMLIQGVGALWIAFQAGPPILAAVSALFTPIAGVILAIAGAVGVIGLAVYQLWQTNEDFRNNIIDIWNSIRDTFGPIFDDISTYFSENKDVVNAAGDVWKEFKGLIVDVVDGIHDAVVIGLAAINYIWTRWGEDIMRVTSGFITGVLHIIQGVLRIIRGVFNIIAGLITGDWSKMWRGVQQIASGAMMIVRTLIQGWLAWWRGIFNLIAAAAQAGMTRVREFIVNQAVSAVERVRNVLGGIVEFVRGLGGRITGAAAGMWNGITSALGSVVQRAKDLINSLGFDIHVPEAFPGPSTYHVGVQLARGGVIDHPVVAEIGEGGETEIVTPERLMRQIVEDHSSGTEIDYGRMAEEVSRALVRALTATGAASTKVEQTAHIKVEAGLEANQVAGQVVDGISFELRRQGFGGKRNDD